MEELESGWDRMWENREWVNHWDTPPDSDGYLNMPFRFMVGPNSAQRLRAQGVIATLGQVGRACRHESISFRFRGFQLVSAARCNVLKQSMVRLNV
jgi:hypothetical protein